jgi:tRNA threonylcarbamoyladenosine biosynthesis protein TsaB
VVKILACDTALGALSAAVILGERALANEFVEMVRGHAEALAPMVARVMRASGLAFADLDRLAVTTGPGTFTGQRVGLAFMRAAAMALKRPLIGVTTTDAMAAGALARTGAAWALAVADAKRGEVYLGAMDASGSALLQPLLIPFAAAVSFVERMCEPFGPPVLAGTGAEPMLAALRERGIGATDSGVRQPDAVFVAHLARTRPIPDTPPKPLYLRAPDAKLPS